MAEAELSVVIPAYNEAGRIGRTLRDIDSFGRSWGRPLEVLVSDDGSRDATAEVVQEAAGQLHGIAELRVLSSCVNRGKGHAVRTGVLASRGRYVLFCDADGATPFWEIPHLMEALRSGCDVAIGSRDLEGSRIVVPQPWYRRLMGAVMRQLTRRLLVADFRDTQCGFKLFTRRAAMEIFRHQTLDGFGFDVEVLLLARRLGYTVCEVPIEWHDRPGGKVHPIRSSLEVLRDLVVLRLRYGSVRAPVRGRAPAHHPTGGAAPW